MSSYLSIKNVDEIQLNDVRGILIDIDDTLYSYEKSHKYALKVCYESFQAIANQFMSLEDFVAVYTKKRTAVKDRLGLQGAARSRLFAFQDFFEELNIERAYSKALDFEDLYWNKLIENAQLRVQFKPFFERCSKLDITICGLTDMQARFQILKLKKFGLDVEIKYLVTSEEVGREKPDRSCFDHALGKLKLKPSEVIMIGDNYAKDIVGAINLGIKGFLLEVE